MTEQVSFPGNQKPSELRIGFTVGMTPDGSLEFRVIGNPTPAEVAALIYYADFQVKKLLDTQFKSADTLSLSALNKLAIKLNEIEGLIKSDSTGRSSKDI